MCKYHISGARSHSTAVEPKAHRNVEQQKRSICNVTKDDDFQAMLAADDRKARRLVLKGEKRKADEMVTLSGDGSQPKRPSLLGPILEQRFSTAASSNCD